jgi:hypothetical protein
MNDLSQTVSSNKESTSLTDEPFFFLIGENEVSDFGSFFSIQSPESKKNISKTH